MIVLKLSNSFKKQLKILNTRLFSIHPVVQNQEKFSVELIPEVKNAFESGKMKHRHHPGIRQVAPLTLPDVLATSVDKLITEKIEKNLIEEAKSLCKHLHYRRLPAEKEEINEKISKLLPSFEDDEPIPDNVIKQEEQKIRKMVNIEIGRWKPIEYNYNKCLAYLVGRLSPNYTAISHIFNELKRIAPAFQPKTFFDFGSGVGSALWAAHSHWSDSISEYFCTDISVDMNDLCSHLITDEITEEKYIKPVFFRQFLPASDLEKYDLVVSAFSLLELTNRQERDKVVDTLWRKTKEYLVIIEQGTVAGFSCVLDARDLVLLIENNPDPKFVDCKSGAHVISPCPHDFMCPKFLEDSGSSCRFHVYYNPQFPRHQSKVILKDYISYVILKKSPRTNDCEVFPRIVKPVLKRTRHVFCRLCCSDGKLKEVIVTKAKHGRHAYRCARTSDQGDSLPVILKPLDFVDNE